VTNAVIHKATAHARRPRRPCRPPAARGGHRLLGPTGAESHRQPGAAVAAARADVDAQSGRGL